MSGLRFGFLTTFYPPYNFGGDGIGIQRLARGLVHAGHRVTVIHDVDAYRALAPREPPPGEPEPDGLEVVPLRSGMGVLSPFLVQQTGRPLVTGRRMCCRHRQLSEVWRSPQFTSYQIGDPQARSTICRLTSSA